MDTGVFAENRYFADVVKPRGAPPGEVELRRWERVRLYRAPRPAPGRG